ncbi:FxsA family protein [Egicoccus sp. AB-alg2]|uniref:FxsA family protein n=1 Tax=Egicoccus sp. AB-alg2 TaxID=3242693 RepID=UPI00359ECD22
MPFLLVLAFVVVPLVEIAVIIQVGQVIGTLPTIAILVLDSLLGAWLLKREGRRAWQKFRAALDELRWPGDEVTQGALVIVGGTLLLTPGFVTDVVGFLLLLPPTRRILARMIRARLNPLGGATSDPDARQRERGRGRSTRGVMDVEVVEIHRDDPDDDADAEADGGPSGDLPPGRG